MNMAFAFFINVRIINIITVSLVSVKSWRQKIKCCNRFDIVVDSHFGLGVCENLGENYFIFHCSDKDEDAYS